ncbi:DUF1822 family protein [Pantanalinema rosaneae CENA516]|uniref:DUF1822 family protein n=1 Tax=Pantanalinema rosaneae TaxID=1620701 RepID=UPI003D6E7C9B
MSFMFEPLTQLMLDIPTPVEQDSWQQSQLASSGRGQWQTFLNHLCVTVFLPWLQTEYVPTATTTLTASTLPTVWDVVNGTVLSCDRKRLVLIPDKSVDTSELRVPQEWVDVPGWAGDYFLAVQVNADAGWLRVWGYTTHEMLKTMGTYDPGDRTYGLDAQQVIQDVSALWVVQQLAADEPTQAAIAPLPTVPVVQADHLLQRLANLELDQPRLEIPFELWGALITDDGWRQRLYQYRQGQSTIVHPITQLGQWFQHQFEAGWQALETLLGEDANLAYSFRQTADLTDVPIKGAKLLQLPTQAVLLLVSVEAMPNDDQVGIRAQLRSRDRQISLPEGLSLHLLATDGEVIQSVQARQQDEAIQLKRFRIPSGTPFTLQITWENEVFTEPFIA